MFSMIFSMGHISVNATYAPAMGINAVIIKIQMANILPKILTPPSAFVEENNTKYPTTNPKVAGMKLKKKHIDILC